ncbi:BLUF domain-containing protein [Salinarimonas chemoclinalis]|uniref:BLUF domain-containing protein n=1 Tax=Salinarimonas chemoclinalis TaxID=3241599 RepID=UPI00355833B8
MLNRSSLSRISYFSRCTLDRDQAKRAEQLDRLVRSSRRQNEFGLITSILVLDRGWFGHMLEGDRDALNTTFKRIASDNRHKEVRIIEWREIPRRELLPSLELLERNLMTQDVLEKYALDEAFARGTPKPMQVHECMLALQQCLLAKRGIEALT